LDGDAALAVWEIFDASDLADVFVIERILGNVKGERDEQAHANIENQVLGEEVDAIARDVFGGGGFLEMGIARIGRANLEGLANADAAAAATLLLFNCLHIDMTTRKGS